MELVLFLQLLFLVLLGGLEGVICQSTTGDAVYFVGAPYQVIINQNHLRGSVLFHAQCARNGSQRTDFHYSILSSQNANYFSIDSLTGAVTLTVNALDVADHGPWSPIILCTDQGSSLSNSDPVPTRTQFDVRFQLQNRFAPVFDPPGPIYLSFREDQSFPYDIIILNVTDEDLGVCGEFELTINGRNRMGPFLITQSSNVLQLISQLDYETSTSYMVPIKATNVHSSCIMFNSTHSTIFVHINVENINDEPPMFTEHERLFQFNETTMPQNFVQLSCHDPDTPPDSIVYTEEYRLSDNPFRIDHRSGMVSAVKEIDYEASTSYELQFACVDTLNPQLRDETTISIQVLPVNEYLPRVNTAFFFCQISELAPSGTLIGSSSPESGAVVVYRTSDADRGLDHGDIRYRFSSINSDMDFVNKHFNLESESGDLRINAPFEYYSCNESVNVGNRLITLRIVVCDRFDHPVDTYGCPIVVIRILLTRSDCIPTFLKNQTFINVTEGTTIGTRLQTLPCDVRGQETSERTIEILSLDQDVLNTFMLEDDTIVLRGDLDYETTQNYSFFLECSDDTNSNVASVYVQVVPENDNKPYFEKNLFVFSVNKSVVNSKVAFALEGVRAFDDDVQTGNELEYSLSLHPDVDGNDDVMEYFSIDTIFGTITMSGNAKLNRRDVFVFDVTAFDGNFSAKSSVLVKTVRHESVNICSETGNGSKNSMFIAVGILILLMVILLLVLLVTMVYACCRSKRTKVMVGHRMNNSGTSHELQMGYSLHKDRPTPLYSKTNGVPPKYLESNLDFPEKQDELDYHYVAPNSFQGPTSFGHATPVTSPQTYLVPSTGPNESDEYLVMCSTSKSTVPGTNVTKATMTSLSGHGESPSSVGGPLPDLPLPPVPATTGRLEGEGLRQSPNGRCHSIDNIYEHIQ